MKNLNPLYEQQIPAQNQQQSGMSFGQGLALTYGTGAVTGITSKIIKDQLLLKKILRDYPTPMSFKNALYKLPGQSRNKTILLAKLQPNISQDNYIKLLRKYVCRGSLGRYMAHGLGSVFSTVGNMAGMADNALSSTNDVVNSNVL